MSAPVRKGSLFTGGPDRWLVLAGAGLLVLGLVLRLLTDIGRSTATGDRATPVADTAAVAQAPSTTAETLAATPPAPVPPIPTPPSPAPQTGTADPAGASPTNASTALKSPSRPAPVATSSGGWSVQLGVFGSAENAARLQSRVSALGYRATLGPSGALTRVRVVGLADRAAAQQAADSLARTLGTAGIVMSPGH